MLIREGAYFQTSGNICVEVVQEVMIYGSETCIMTTHIGRVLGGFHHRVARRLTRRQYRRGQDYGWVYPQLEYAMAEAILLEVETYVSHHYNKVAKLIVTRPIIYLCLAAEHRPRSRVSKRWWDQDRLEL